MMASKGQAGKSTGAGASTGSGGGQLHMKQSTAAAVTEPNAKPRELWPRLQGLDTGTSSASRKRPLPSRRHLAKSHQRPTTTSTSTTTTTTIVIGSSSSNNSSNSNSVDKGDGGSENSVPLRASRNQQSLHALARRGDVDQMRALVAVGLGDVNQQDRRGQTPLHAAVRAKQLGAAAFLLDHGADVHVHGPRGNTPLHIAADAGFADGCRLLLKHGADKLRVNEQFQTCVDMCSARRLPLLFPEEVRASMAGSVSRRARGAVGRRGQQRGRGVAVARRVGVGAAEGNEAREDDDDDDEDDDDDDDDDGDGASAAAAAAFFPTYQREPSGLQSTVMLSYYNVQLKSPKPGRSTI